MRVLLRLFGVRTVESAEAVRVTLPKWIVRLLPGMLEDTRRKLAREHPTALDVRIVNRSIIARIR